MSNIMVSNMMLNAAPGKRPDPKAQVDPGNEDNFSRYLDKKVKTERRERSCLLGVKNQARLKNNDKELEAKKEDTTADETSVAAFLQQLLADLRTLAEKSSAQVVGQGGIQQSQTGQGGIQQSQTGQGGIQPPQAGQWSFQLKSMGLLDQLAGQAGMNPADLAQLKKQMDSKGALTLADLFTSFEKYFQTMQKPTEVTAPETDLPMLESLLNRMGVDAGTLSKLSEQSVDGQGKFDLAAYLQGLNKLQDNGALKPAKTSDLDLEQLGSMLASAGVSKSQMAKMFPEKIAAWQQVLSGMPKGADTDKPPATMTMDRLKGLLAQTISDVKASKAEVNLPGFLQKLSDVLSQAGFVKQGAGWSPVVQNSLTKVYQELQKMVDLSKVRVNKVSEIITGNKDLAEQWQASAKTFGASETVADGTAGKNIVEAAVVIKSKIESLDTALDKTPEKDVPQDVHPILTPNQDASQVSRGASDFKAQNVMRPQSVQVLQQFAIDQLSQGVMQSLQRDEHHLVLTMYPKELGEVKVDVQIRNNSIAVSFVMDNHKVKQALEKNMNEFKENLNRQGYSLEACAVMVDHHQNNSDDTKQRFESAWEDMMAVKGTLAGNNANGGEVLASLTQASGLHSGRWADSSISLFV